MTAIDELIDLFDKVDIVENKVLNLQCRIDAMESRLPGSVSEPEPLKEKEPKRWWGFCQGCEYVEASAYDKLKADFAESRQACRTLKTERDAARKEVDRLRDQNNVLYRHNHGDFWIWQDDGENHLESLCSEALIEIRAGQLRDLLVGGDKA